MEDNLRDKNIWLQNNLIMVLVGFFLLVIVFAGFFSYSLSGRKAGVVVDNTPTTVTQPQPAQKSDSPETANSGPQVQIISSNPGVEEIVKKVFKHVFLPSGDLEVQTVAKPDELRKVNPIFYEFAKVGDYVLIYKDRAVLYDPVADRVLDIVHNPAPGQPK